MLFKKYIENSNMEEFIKVPKFFLSLLGVWPLGETKLAWVYYLHSFVCAYIVAILFLASLLFDMYSKLGDLAEAADALYYCITQLGYVIKFIIFSFKGKQFLGVLDDIENPLFFQHRFEQEKHLKYWSKVFNIYSYTFLSCCFTCLLFYALFPLIDSDEEHILPMEGWFPFDVRYNLVNRTIVYVFQLFSLMSAIMINASLDILPAALMNISCAQLEILKDNLETATLRAEKITELSHQKKEAKEKLFGNNDCNLLTQEEDDFVSETLCRCVIHHQAIIKFLSIVEAMFNLAMFVQFLESSVTICITGLQLIVSSNISASCYNMDWYRCSPRVKKIILIIMERCKRPIVMTAGNIFVLSIVTLTALLRTTYSYFAVLRKVYTE